MSFAVLAGVLAAATFASSDSALPGYDWPQWRGPQQNGMSNETGLLKTWPENGLPEVWRKPIGEAYSSVSIAGNRLYTMDSRDESEFVVCLDARTGDEIWRTPSEGYTLLIRNIQGPNSTPLISEGRVYTAGSTGTILCLDSRTGEEIWSRNVLGGMGVEAPGWSFASSPVLVDGKIIVNPGGQDGKSVVALDSQTGDVVWSALDYKATYSTPIVAEALGVRQLIFFMPTGPTGVSPDNGAEIWHFPWPTENGANIITPLLHGDFLFISAAYNQGAGLIRLDAIDGKIEAELVWENKRFENWFNDPILLDGYLYGFDRDQLKCIDFETGQEQWAQKGFLRGQLISAEGRLIVLGEKGNLALVDPAPGAYREISQFQALEGKCWAPPALAHGKIYVRHQKEIVCFDLRR